MNTMVGDMPRILGRRVSPRKATRDAGMDDEDRYACRLRSRWKATTIAIIDDNAPEGSGQGPRRVSPSPICLSMDSTHP
jgi:hypothetical protein